MLPHYDGGLKLPTASLHTTVREARTHSGDNDPTSTVPSEGQKGWSCAAQFVCVRNMQEPVPWRASKLWQY